MPAKGPRQAKEIKPSMAGYISGSLRLLSRQPLPDDTDIHDIRVMMKKYRAAIRLARPLLDEAVYDREYRAGREAGRILSSWRETAVLRKTVRALRKANPELFLKLWDNEQIQGLLRKPYSTWSEAGEQAKTISEISDNLTRANHRLRFISLHEPDFRLLLTELERSYLAAASIYLECRHDRKPELLHEFRKKSKTLMYQLAYFRHLNPSVVKSLEKKLDNITQTLGRYNDLEQILALTGYSYGNAGNSDLADELAIVIRDRQDEYLMKVWPLAYRLFAPGKKLDDLLGMTLR